MSSMMFGNDQNTKCWGAKGKNVDNFLISFKVLPCQIFRLLIDLC